MGLMASGIATTEQGTKGPNDHMQDIYPFPQRQTKHVTCFNSSGFGSLGLNWYQGVCLLLYHQSRHMAMHET